MITPIIGHGHVHADFDLTKRYGSINGHWDFVHPLKDDKWVLQTYDTNRNKLELDVDLRWRDLPLIPNSIERYFVGGYTKILNREEYSFDIWGRANLSEFKINTDASGVDNVIGYGILYDASNPDEFDKDVGECLNNAYIAAYRESPSPEADSRIRAAFETVQPNGTIEYDELDICTLSFDATIGIPTDSEIDLLKISNFRIDHEDGVWYYYRFDIHGSKVTKKPIHLHEIFLNV